MSYPEAPDHTGIAPKHKEAAERAKAGEANNVPMTKPKKLTASQKEKIEELKAALGYEHKGLKSFEIENGGEYSKYFASVRGEGNNGERFYALVGTKGAIRHLTVYYRFSGHHEYEKDEAERHIRYTLQDMEKKGLWKYPQRKKKPEPSVYGIQFYTVGKPVKGWSQMGVHRNATTEKYFKWAFPKEEMWGVIFEYVYLSMGEGILLVDIPEGEGKPDGYGTPDNRERINFYYEPREVLSVRNIGYEEDLSEDAGRGRTDFSKRFGRSLTNRQIIAKVFKAWLGSKGLL